MKEYPIIAKQLFDEDSYQKIIKFMEERIPFLSVGIDNNEFIRTYCHNLPFFVKMHHQLIDFASENFGEKVKPSYCFLSMYKKNGICPLHIDRPQCRYTIDYLIRIENPKPWPIHIGKHMTDEEIFEISEQAIGHPNSEELKNKIINEENWSDIFLEENDAVLYSGTHSWHYRSERLVGTADLVFFHFVPENFNGPLN